jgi:citrate lyase beta subunit
MTPSPRSVLYVPASQRRLLDKIPGVAADLVIVDLEDGVAPGDKDAARENVRRALSAGTLATRPWALRVNAGANGPPPEDLTLIGFAKPTAVVLPKAEDPSAVRSLATRFAEHGAWTALMIETACGVAHVASLARAHADVRMLIAGSADLRLSLGARPDPGRQWERHALWAILLAARVHGAAAIDSVYFHYRDLDGLRTHAAIARELGFDGKSCIHPAQLPVVHEVYGSTPEELAWARRVLAAWESGQGVTKGVVAMDGEMIEALHVALARRLLG